MIIAVVKDDGVVVNLIICDSVETAQTILPCAECINGDGLIIGDESEASNDN